MLEVAKNVEKVTKKHGGKNFEFSKSEKEAEDLWAGRKAALWSVLALREGSRVWTTDVWWVFVRSCFSVSFLSFSFSLPILEV